MYGTAIHVRAKYSRETARTRNGPVEMNKGVLTRTFSGPRAKYPPPQLLIDRLLVLDLPDLSCDTLFFFFLALVLCLFFSVALSGSFSFS